MGFIVVFIFPAEPLILKLTPNNPSPTSCGITILPKTGMQKLKNLKPGQGGEIHVTDAIKQLIKNGESFYANIFQGKYLDCGTLSGYIDSGIQISKEKK